MNAISIKSCMFAIITTQKIRQPSAWLSCLINYRSKKASRNAQRALPIPLANPTKTPLQKS